MDDKHSLTKRLTVSAVIISIVYYIVYGAPDLVFILLNIVLITFALFEFYTLAEAKGFCTNKILAISLGIFFPLFVYFPGESFLITLSIFVILFLNFNKKSKGAFVNTSITLFGLLYIALLLSYCTKIKFLVHGTQWVGYLIWVTKMSDACAYFVGSKYGKIHPYGRMSPNKSLEGSIGGLIGAIIVSLVFKLYIRDVSFSHFLILGFLIGVLGQVGDLTESLIKRELEAKDSGILPGLGGILDIVDSIIFTAPFLYYYLLVYVR